MIARSGVSAVLAAGLLLAAGSGALAQTSDPALQNRLDQLERQVISLQRDFYSSAGRAPAPSGAGNAPLDASATVRLDQLETELRRLTGQIEELRFAIRQNDDKLTRFIEDAEYRLRALEQGGAPAGETAGQGAAGAAAGAAATGAGAPLPSSGQSPQRVLGTVDPSRIPPAPRDVPDAGSQQAAALAPTGDARADYERAFALLQRKDFEAAESAFTQFLDAYPDHSLAGNAEYWLGETHYVRGAYEDAASAFLDGFRKYPDSPKAPDSLLKLGMTLAALNQPQEACLTFDEVATRYPEASAAIKRRTAIEKARNGCR